MTPLFLPPVVLLHPWPDLAPLPQSTAHAGRLERHTYDEEPQLTVRQVDRLVRQARAKIHRNLRAQGIEADWVLMRRAEACHG